MKIWLVRKLSCIVLTSRSKGMIYLLAIYQKKGQKALKANFEVLINYHEADNLGWWKYVAFMVKVSIHEQLIRGAIATFGSDNAKWFSFRYNFWCMGRRLVHVEDDCDECEAVKDKSKCRDWLPTYRKSSRDEKCSNAFAEPMSVRRTEEEQGEARVKGEERNKPTTCKSLNNIFELQARRIMDDLSRPKLVKAKGRVRFLRAWGMWCVVEPIEFLFAW